MVKPVRKDRSINPWAFLDEYRGEGTGGVHFSGEWPTLPELFRITALRHGGRNCLTAFEPERVTLNYNETLQKIDAVARWLHEKGIRKGDKIAVTGKNAPEWVVAYLAALFANAIILPVDHQLKDGELDLIIKTARPRVLFIDEEKYQRYHDSKGESGLEEVISLKKGLGDYIYTLDGPAFTQNEPVSENDLAAILFTSGTTGIPKGVMLSHKNLVSDCFLAQGTPLDVFYFDVFYALLPLHHAYTMLAVFIEAISQGAEIVLGKKMVVSTIMKELKEGKVTMFLGVPLLFNKLLTGIFRGVRQKGIVIYGLIRCMMAISGFIKKTFLVNPGKTMFRFILDQASLTTIRICISGGGPLAPSVFRKYNQLGIDFVQGYGLTETSPIINLNPVEHYKEQSVGKVIPGIDMKIIDADERGVGEIALKGPVVMQGYFEMPEDTRMSFTEDGYFKTGDLGYLDGENYLYLTGRAKNVIVTDGGKNVYPEEIENEFQLFEEIEQVLIKGFVRDKKTKSENIEALIFPAADFFKTPPNSPNDIPARMNEIVLEVNKRLSPYQKIEKITLLDAPLEMTTTKKIMRHGRRHGRFSPGIAQ
jgi:long-chain acyl-CoA synthetase